MLKTIQAGVLYFAIVFGVGFVLGTIRTLLVVPLVGMRRAELMEAPIMILVSFLAARWIVRRMELPSVLAPRLGMGVIALLLLLAAEFGFVLWLRGISLQQYFATRDPVAGSVYYVALLVFALAPGMVERNAAFRQ